MNVFDIYGYQLGIDGSTDALDKLSNAYGSFSSTGTDVDINLQISQLTQSLRHEHKLGGAKRFYGRSEDRFTLRDHASTIAVDEDWTEVACSSKASTSTLTTLLEGQLRQQLAPEGKAMIHGSGVRYEGETLLFPAWRHTGKTNTMLSFAVRGGDFLSDDRLFVDERGMAHSYPMPINLLQYNLRAFPELLARSNFERFKDRLSMALASQTEGMPEHSFVRGVLDYLNNHVIKDSYKYHPSDLFEDIVTIPQETPIDKLVLLETTESDIDHCRIEPIEAKTMARILGSITDFEWNTTLHDTYSAYDMLFPERDGLTDQLMQLRSREREVYEAVAETADVYRLQVPEEEEWSRETQQRVVETTIGV
ncbi:hypothetical protein GRX01_11030 [Halobaculum sp. WSA2]|uniref:Uncharacterized protein n=1 Tax=Halobaculum saliterrae TaxID=2073113 RepID=A0A6B0STI3_9EURY|nr:hypothetical protein [Halobaculum saliterrae]MXR41867.1 hypothetical protein [Halobaculum saliterrae]